MEDNFQSYTFQSVHELNEDEKKSLEKQNSRKISDFVSLKLEIDAKKNWDLFYKRNETRFFRDRHWTQREFHELLGDIESKKVLLEVGCGVGNLVFPLKEERLNLFYYLCDFSPRAIALVKENPAYDPNHMKAFLADLTIDDLKKHLSLPVDICTLIFVLSAIHPAKFKQVLKNLWNAINPGGLLLFRDYGIYDMTQIRFKPGHKIDDHFYMRQDGTRSYFFSLEFVRNIFREVGFSEIYSCYVHRRTINKKEGINVPRIYVQAKFHKP